MTVEIPQPRKELDPSLLKRNPEYGMTYYQRLELNRKNLLTRLNEDNWSMRKQDRRRHELKIIERILDPLGEIL